MVASFSPRVLTVAGLEASTGGAWSTIIPKSTTRYGDRKSDFPGREETEVTGTRPMASQRRPPKEEAPKPAGLKTKRPTGRLHPEEESARGGSVSPRERRAPLS